MASVQYLTTFTSSVVEELKDQQRVLDIVTKFRWVCAVVLQKSWRGYAARNKYLKIKYAVSTIHRYFLGWKVRKNRHVYEELSKLAKSDLKRGRAAVKIQAWWKGTMTRKAMKGRLPKDFIEQRRMVHEQNIKMQNLLREGFKRQEISSSEEDKQLLAFVLFKCHHLLRTKTKEGIYSKHDSKNLSFIEQMMKAVPLTDYMKKIRKCYKQGVKTKSEIEYQYLSSSKRVRYYEDLMRNRDKSHDIKETPFIPDESIHKEQFKCSTLVPQKPYEREMFRIGKYSSAKDNLSRQDDKNAKPFVLNPKLELTDDNIPYYIDFWIRECDLHDVTGLD